ncbi:hypothetical protein AGABI1DRAFT_126565 [Agaricus bisporus var. burnettii JB137-S8]|uniref:C2H2-type domain-containing protein n=1 Tax=Agaricus bisporus var. burnettii (strain JB137-S8 / ATCC MYA-4627 / FGSC 10392) TaxID=597362 RepID=K5W5X9_AGABU|nr:uncharacterized protein AGABI1DRAFT_126565 [Agaricus bisporus var. burnettii JB137-S8]EKM82234.1 hypothetical protein AGABI1DRAFT_126565 [Agaricus bisporus var. burnettii JB137-S8]
MRPDNENSRPPPPDLVSTHTLTPVTTALSNDQHSSGYDQHSSGYDPQYSGSSMSVDGNSIRAHSSLDSAESRLNQSIITADSNTSTTSTTSTNSTTSTKSTTSTSSLKKSRAEEEEEDRLEYASASGSGVDGDRSGSAMDLDDFNQLFGLGIDLDINDAGVGGIGQPLPIQNTSTITPAQLHLNSNSDSNQSNDVHDFSHDMSGISLPSQGSMDHLHLLDQYLDLALHNSKPFGSFSDFSSPFAGLAGDESAGLNRSIEMNSANMQMRGRTLTGTNISLGERHQQDGGIAIAYPLSYYQHRSQPLATTSSPAAPPILEAHSLTNYRSTSLLGYPCNTSGSSIGVSSINGGGTSTTPSTNSFVQSSPEFVPPSSVSPLTLQYDSKGRVVVDPNGSASGGTGEGSLSLSNVGSDGLSFAFSELNGSGGVTSASRPPWIFQGDGGGKLSRSPASGTGASNLIMRRATSTLVGSSSKLGSGRGMRKGARRGKQQQVMEMSIPLPIPTRSKKPSLIGWEGNTLATMVTSTPASPPRTASTRDILPVPPYIVSQTSSESRKRKRSPELDSDDDVIVNVEKVSRRELLGLRKISKDTEKKWGEEEEMSGGERKRKRRRIGSLSGPQKKEKGKEKRKIVWTSDDDGSDDSDDEDAYFPSSDPSSPGINDEPGPSSRPLKSLSRLRSLSSSCTKSTYRRSSSAVTLKTPDSEITSISPDSSKDEDDTKPYGVDKHNKGKARGSAALALATVTMLSGKPPTSVWGTYVPFPLDDDPGEVIIRSGRTRRNGHIPLPVPVPDLIKKSRGRKVPHQESKKKLDYDDSKREFICEVLGCGKCFVRGEHLKRHVRSIHTHDKPHPCPYEGCDKSFSRRDNLGQHVRIHLQSSSS